MAGLGYLMVLVSIHCVVAVPVLFLIFIIRAKMKRGKKWFAISAAICGFLVLPLFVGGCILVGSDEEFQAEYGGATHEPPSLETTASTAETTLKTTPEPPVIETTTVPPETTTTTSMTTEVTTTTPPETTTTTEPPVITTTAPMTTKAPKTTKATTTKTPETTTTEPPITFEEVYIAYQENELRASEMYKGERIRFSGTVDTIQESFLGTTTVWINVYAQGWEHWVLCSFNTKDQKDNLMELTAGDYVTIEGTCVDWMSWGLCEIVE